nr:ribonuclease H-like domain-containing protein [Tanacetum cinerariifolium]
VKKGLSQDEGNFVVFFHFENNKINRIGLRVLRDSFAYKEYGIRLMIAPRSAKALQEKVLLKLHGIRKLLEQVVTIPGNAKALWDLLKDLFHDNKDARAINLDNELRSIKIGKMTVNEYCTKIWSMADRLINLGCVLISPIPKSPFLALKGHHWCNAMHDEYNALVKNVANGSSQQLGVDFNETFSPVVKPTTIRTIFSLVVSRKWLIHQLDVKNAFLNGDLYETVYMHEPSSFVDSRLQVMPLGPGFIIVVAILHYLFIDRALRSTSETAWLHNLLRELHSPLSTVTLVYCDNVLLLQEFDIEIKDRKGTENVAADHLARIENEEISDASEVDDNFSGETLMEINNKNEPSPQTLLLGGTLPLQSMF